jgi:hypothetical protein
MGRATTTGRAAAIAGAAVLACAGAQGPPVAPPPSPDRQFSYSVMDLRDSALNAHDLDTVAAAYAEDAEVIDAETGLAVLHGRAEIRRAHERFLRACPGARVEVLDRAFASEGSIVADLERIHCRDGRAVEGRVRYEIRKGTIVRVLQHGSPLFPG